MKFFFKSWNISKRQS